MPNPNWPERLDGYEWKPAYFAVHRKERGLPTPDKMPAKPKGIVVHSGDFGPGTAQWAWRKDARFWAHFAWDSVRNIFVQTDSLQSWAPHAGSLNGISWGIELPGPYKLNPRPELHKTALIDLVKKLTDLGAEWITGHKFVADNKKDPGPGVTADWFAGLPLRVYWKWIGTPGLLAAEKKIKTPGK